MRVTLLRREVAPDISLIQPLPSSPSKIEFPASGTLPASHSCSLVALLLPAL